MNKHIGGKLSDLVKISEQFARSTRIDKDDIDQFGFIYSESIDNFLKKLIQNQSQSNQDEPQSQQSAYTWTGPYGSGKSTLALSLSSVLSGNAAAREKAAQKYNQDTAKELWEAFPPKQNGWEIISLVGGKRSLEDLLKKTLISHSILKSEDFPENLEDEELRELLISALIKHSSAQETYGGLILLIDEMGKLLEAASEGNGDINFYQSLAEAASRSNGRFILIGILHQSFKDYANPNIKKDQDEFDKVQGRFKDIPINLNSLEQLELIAATLSSNTEHENRREISNKTFELLFKLKRAPNDQIVSLLNRCWPLNPLTALSLGPISKKSYGQNQRSIFNFLASGEPLALKDFLPNKSMEDNWLYSLSNLWDYLDINWGSSIAVSHDSHHFANVKDALLRLESFEDVRPEHEAVLKSISILDLTSRETGINASSKALQIALDSTAEQVREATDYLTEKSLIIFKKHKDSFALYEGSDFDIEDELTKALQKAPKISVADIALKFAPKEIVAKRHYLQTGNLRWAEMAICTEDEVSDVVKAFEPKASSFALFLIVSSEEEGELSLQLDANKEKYILLGRNTIPTKMFELFNEYWALEEISRNSNALLKDKVARRELSDRREAIHEIISTKFSDFIQKTKWIIQQKGKTEFSLSRLASDVADAIFSEAPVIKNELINRNRPSGSANGGLKALLYAMADHEVSKDLGFQKFPPERGLYESIIKKNNLHLPEEGVYKFQNPLRLDSSLDLGNLKPIWKNSMKLLKSNRDRKVPLTELQDMWMEPPFGLKKGLFPLLSVLFYLTNKETLAYYREEIFITDFTDFDVDYFLKTPQYVELRWLDMDAQTKRLLSALATIPADLEQSEIVSIEPLEVARALVASYDKIEPWANRTNTVSQNAKKVRSLFKRASDPAQLTLNDLPSIYGDIDLNVQSNLDDLVSRVKDGLEELRKAFGGVITGFRYRILGELGVPHELSESNRTELNERAMKIRGISGDNRMESFIFKLSEISNSDEDFEDLAWLILNKPADKWIDLDTDKLLVEATRFAREFRNLETMASINNREETSYSFALVSHTKRGNGSSLPKVFELNENELETAKHLIEKMKKLKTADNRKADNKSILAALAILSNEMEQD